MRTIQADHREPSSKRRDPVATIDSLFGQFLNASSGFHPLQAAAYVLGLVLWVAQPRRLASQSADCSPSGTSADRTNRSYVHYALEHVFA